MIPPQGVQAGIVVERREDLHAALFRLDVGCLPKAILVDSRLKFGRDGAVDERLNFTNAGHAE
jgi:hypothetical protein